MAKSIPKYLFVLPLIFILALSYWRYTYILNPNFQGESLLLEYRFYIKSIGANSLINIRSILIYWILFFLGNVAFFFALFNFSNKVKLIGVFYLFISVLSAVFFGSNVVWHSHALFSLGAILKNFILSPMFTAMAFIVVEYFHLLVRKY